MQYGRGQGATEYLVILGAVLLVALVIVSLLGWFPSLGGATKEQQSKSYWQGTSPFAITSYKVNNTSITMSVANRLADRLNLTAVELQDGFGNTVPVMAPLQYFNAGEEAVIANYTFYAGSGGSSSGNNPCFSASAARTGSMFEFKVVAFTYTQGVITGIRQQGAQSLVGRCS
jgi:hypothetical protein